MSSVKSREYIMRYSAWRQVMCSEASLAIWSERFAQGPYQENTPPAVRLEPAIRRLQSKAFYQWSYPDPQQQWHIQWTLKVGWRGETYWLKLQCNRHSRSAPKSVLKMAKLAPSEKNVFKRGEPNRPFIWRIISQVGWLVNGQALKVDRFLPGFTESVPIFGTPHNHWHIPKAVHKSWEWI